MRDDRHIVRERSLARYILVSFSLFFLLFSIGFGLWFYHMFRIKQNVGNLHYRYVQLSVVLDELQESQFATLSRINIMIDQSYVSRRDRIDINTQLSYRLKAISRAFDVIALPSSAHIPKSEQKSFKLIAQRLEGVRLAFKKSSTEIERNLADNSGFWTPVHRVEKRIYGVIHRLGTQIRGHVAELSIGLERQANVALLMGSGALLFLLFLGIVMAFQLRRLVGMLRRLRDAAHSAAHGRFSTVSGPFVGELNELAIAFNTMSVALNDRETQLIRSERLAAIGGLASRITHEVRNPLSAISLNTEMLIEDLSAEHSASTVLAKEIAKEVDRLSGITELYLSFAKRPKLSRSDQLLSTVVSEVVAFQHVEFQQSGFTIEFTPSSTGLHSVISFDAAQVKQALLNILANARDAMRDSGIGDTVRVVIDVDDDWQHIIVEDNGPGIDSDNIQSVFEPFFSTKDTGTGLGLVVTQQIMFEHGGKITINPAAADKTLLHGTRVTLSLPKSPSQRSI